MKTAIVFRRVFSVCLVLIMLIMAIPVSCAEGYASMNINDIMKKFDSRVQRPKKSSILDEPETVYVRSNYGNCIYVRSKPDKNSKKLFKADEGKAVIVYARESGFALGLVKGTSIGGWRSENLLDADSGKGRPGPDDTKGLSSGIYRPRKNDYLKEYETMYVKSKYGNCIYLYNNPNVPEIEMEILGKVKEATECTLIAWRNNMYFVRTANGQRGWVKAEKLTYVY